MNLADVIHKLEFSINAYQNLLDTNVQEGIVIGPCDIGTWHADTPLNKAYSDMIEALQISKKIAEQYLLSQTDCGQSSFTVTSQEPRCKDCKWWKDSDGKYRRGLGTESRCPINTHAVYSGEGYCYMFSPKADMRGEEE